MPCRATPAGAGTATSPTVIPCQFSPGADVHEIEESSPLN